MTPLQAKTLQLAEAAYSAPVLEDPPGSNRGPLVDIYERWLLAKRHLKWALGFPWCATFATYQIYNAARLLGITPQIPASASSSELFRWGKTSGNLLSAPEPGCIGLVRAGPHADPGKSHEHTFIVYAVPDHIWVLSIDGNWGQRVSKTHHAIARCDFVRIV